MYEYYSSVDRIWLEQNLAVLLDQVLCIPIDILFNYYATIQINTEYYIYSQEDHDIHNIHKVVYNMIFTVSDKLGYVRPESGSDTLGPLNNFKSNWISAKTRRYGNQVMPLT